MSLRRTFIVLYLMGATFLIAHTINAVIAEALLVPSGVTPPHVVATVDPSVARSPASLADHVRTSGLFPVPQDAVPVGTQEGALLGFSRQPLNLASKMKLLGVVIGERGGVSAIVEMLTTKQQSFFRLHDRIPDAGEVVDIKREGIVVRQGDQQELLELVSPTGEPPQSSKPVAASAAQTAPGSPIKKVLDRREVDQAIGDLPKLLSQARAVPVLVNGAMSGFRLDYVAPSSFYEKIGLQYGDVLKQVNGVEIRDPSTMLTLFQQLRNESTVKLDVMRNNQRTTMTFDIR
jgi:general secretion pathway protein C